MPKVNTTIDNVSPLIRYSSGWTEGSAQLDTFAQNYTDGTFTVSSAAGDSMTITFNGTAIYVFGAKRANHGPYSVALDGGKPATFAGSAVPDLFQTALFAHTGLSQGEHTVVVTNAQTDPSQPYLDIDFITWENSAGTQDASISNATIPYASQAWTYTPQGAWSNVTEGNFTGHRTISSSSATLSFNGDAVILSGAVGPDAGVYTVQVDREPVQSFNATKENFVSGVTLFAANNLGAGTHTVTLMNEPGTSGQSLSLNAAIVSGPSGEVGVVTPNSAEHKPGLSNGALAGISISASMVVAGVFGLLFLLWYRKRAARRRRVHVDLIGSPKREKFPEPRRAPTDENAGAPDGGARRPSALVGPFDRSEDAKSTNVAPRTAVSYYGAPASPVAWNTAFTCDAGEVSSRPLTLMRGPPPTRDRKRSLGSTGSLPNGQPRSLGSTGSLATADTHGGAPRSFGSAGSLATAESMESTTSLLRSAPTSFGQGPSALSRLSLLPELPEPRTPRPSDARAGRFSVTNPDRSDQGSDISESLGLPRPEPAQLASRPRVALPRIDTVDRRGSRPLPIPGRNPKPPLDRRSRQSLLSSIISPRSLPPNYEEATHDIG